MQDHPGHVEDPDAHGYGYTALYVAAVAKNDVALGEILRSETYGNVDAAAVPVLE